MIIIMLAARRPIQILLLFVCCFDGNIQGYLTNFPEDTTVTVGESIRLECVTDNLDAAITWQHKYVGALRPYDVYRDNTLINGYLSGGRYAVNSSSGPGRYDLVINNVQKDDEGEFTCRENGGNGGRKSAYVTVDAGIRPLLQGPSDHIAIVGQTVHLECRSSYKENVWWRHRPVGSTLEKDVYLGHIGFQNGYKNGGRHTMYVDEDLGQYDLVIEDVKSTDAGTYACIDNSGLGVSGQANLIVLDSKPACSSNIPWSEIVVENSCHLKHDLIEMHCNVIYHGNIRPSLKWTSDDIPDTRVNTISSDSQINSSLTVKAKSEIRWRDVACQIGIDETSPPLYTCTPITDHVKSISALNGTSLEKLTDKQSTIYCPIQLAEQCTYQWMTEDHLEIVSDGPTFDPTRPGKYICRADCTIRDQPCVVYPMFVEYGSSVDGNVDGNNRRLPISGVVAWILVVLLSIAVIILAVVLWRCPRPRLTMFTKVKRPNHLDEEMQPIMRDVPELKFFKLSLKGIKGISALDNRLYFVCNDSSTIFILDIAPPYRAANEDITVPDLKQPEDIAGDRVYGCLYISDAVCIWKQAVRGTDIKTPAEPFISSIGGPFTFSVTPSGCVLLVKQNKSNVLETYAPNGQLVKSTDFNSSLKPAILIAAIQLNITDYLAVMTGRLAKLDKHGSLTYAHPPCGSPTISGATSLYVALAKHDRLYVVDKQNCKLYVLNENLRLDRTIPILKSSTEIGRICYDETQSTIFIACHSGIFVLNVSDNSEKDGSATPEMQALMHYEQPNAQTQSG